MASRSDTKRVADATTKLGKNIAEALRSWVQEAKPDEIASDVMDRVREGFDVVFDAAKDAADKARTRAKSTTKKAKRTARRSAKKPRKKASSAAKRKTTRKTSTKKKAVRTKPK